MVEKWQRTGRLCTFCFKGTWQGDGFSGVFAEIGSSWVPYTTCQAVPILASNSRRYSYSKNDSPLSPIQRVGYWIFLKENSLYRWYWESSTPCTSDTVSSRLPVSLSRIVADSAHHRYWESTTPHIIESGSRRLRVSLKTKISLPSICSTLNG
jgi:hypothetical protein